MLQSATLTDKPSARRRAGRRAPRLLGLLALVLLVLALALPAGAAASAAPPTIAVTAPTGTGSYVAGDSLTVSWTTSISLVYGEFGLWVRSSAGGWYLATLVPGASSSSYTTALTLDVPAGSGYQAIVAWRPAAGSGAWTTWGTSSGSFTVTASPAPVITVTAPWGSGAGYPVGSLLTVSWTTSSATASGEFGVWARSPADGWYAAKLWPAGGGTSFNTFLALNVPAGTGYQAIVAWRPAAGSGAWVSWGTSPGSFDVIGDPPLYTITSSNEGLTPGRKVVGAGLSKGSPAHGITPLGTQFVSPGGSITFTITQDDTRKRVDGRKVDGYGWELIVDNVSKGFDVSTYTFSNVRANHTIVAHFHHLRR